MPTATATHHRCLSTTARTRGVGKPLKGEATGSVYAPMSLNTSQLPVRCGGSEYAGSTQSRPSHDGPQIEHCWGRSDDSWNTFYTYIDNLCFANNFFLASLISI